MANCSALWLVSLGELTSIAQRAVPAATAVADVVDTALSILIRDALDLLRADLDALREAVKVRALEHKDTVMIGRTHGVHAEPMTFGLKLALWHDQLSRDRRRILAARAEVASRCVDAARAAARAAASTSARAFWMRPNATTRSSMATNTGVSSTSSMLTEPRSAT